MARSVTYYAASTVTREVIDDLNLTDLNYSEALSSSAGFTASLPLRNRRRVRTDPGAPAIPAVTALDLPGTPGAAMIVDAGASPWEIAGDLDVAVRIALTDWTPATNPYLLSCNGWGDGWHLRLLAGGGLVLRWHAPAGDDQAAAVAATGIADGTVAWIRSTLDVDNGAGQHTVTFYKSALEDPDPANPADWTVIGPVVTGAGVTAITYPNPRDLALGAYFDGATDPMSGRLYRAQVRAGIAGPLVVDVDFGDAAQGWNVGDVNGATGTEAASAKTVTLVGAGSAIVEAEPEVPAIPPTYTFVEVNTRALLEPWANSIYVALGEVLTYGGIITIPKAALGKAIVDVAGKGLLSAYEGGRRTVQSRAGMAHATGDLASDVRWPAGTDLFEVVEDLFDHAATFNGDLGFERVYRGPGVGGLLGVGLEEDLAFATFERRGIFELLVELAGGDPGFDFGLSYSWEDVDGNGRPKVTVVFDAVRGRRTGLVFEAGKNITVLDYELNGEDQANALDGVGAGEGDSMVRTAAVDAELVYPTGRYPRLESTYTNKRATSAALLNAELRGALSRTVRPAEVVTIELIDTDDVPLGSFIAGDLVTLVAEDGFIDLDGSWRIVKYDVAFAADGRPKITANLTPETAYGDLFAGI